jgi:hypothetical protein
VIDDVKRVQARHHHVAYHKIKPVRVEHLDGAITIVCLINFIVRLTQKAHNDFAIAWIVIDHKDSFWHSRLAVEVICP